MKKINNKNAFSLVELTIVIVIMSLLFTVFAVSQKVVEQGRLINAINLTGQQPNIIENNKLMLWLETSMPSRGKKEGYVLKDWDDLSKNKILFVTSSSAHPQSFIDPRIFPGIKSVHFNGSNPMESEKGLNLQAYTAFVVAKPKTNNTGNILESGFKLTTQNIGDSLITVIRNDGSTKSVKKGLEESFVGTTNSDTLNSRPSRVFIGSNGYEGEIFEIIIFDGVLDDEDIYDIETYLYRKYINN